MNDFERDLRDALHAYGHSIHPHPHPPIQRVRRPLARRRALPVSLGLVALTAGGVWLIVRDDGDPTTSVTGSTRVPATSGAATTEDAATSVMTTISTTVPVPTTDQAQPLSFTPVSLDPPPVGYHLVWARYEVAGDGSTYGMVKYSGPDGTPDLALLIRPWSDGIERLPGRVTWEEAGRTVIGDGEGNGSCLPDVCSVGVQWDAHTYVSVMWQQSQTAGLGPQHTLESLVALTADITAQAPPIFVLGSLTDP